MRGWRPRAVPVLRPCWNFRSPSLAQDILDASGGRPVDHVVEVEFGKNIDTLASMMGERGRIVSYGSALDMTPPLPFCPSMFKAVTIELVLVYLLSGHERAAAIENLTALLERKALAFRIAEGLDLADCAKAHDLMAAGGRAGSIILKTS